ncbi:MAG: glycosyltransferase [Planctomycetota bacterium]
MKILHLFANWKWTGPAEPALNVAWRQSREHQVLFLSGTPPEGQSSRITPQAQQRGVATRDGFVLSKHGRFRSNREDARRLVTLLREFQPEIVHCHLDNDHRIASMALSALKAGEPDRSGRGSTSAATPGDRAGPRLVRTAYDPEGLPGSFRVRRIVRRRLDGLIVTTAGGQAQTLAAYGGSARSLSITARPRPMALIEGGVDLERFDPERFDRAAARQKLGLHPEHVAIGIVARVQAHRRYEVLLDAHERVVRRHPELRLVVIGRGTHIEALLLAPIAARGLGNTVLSTGYLAGEEYPAALAALDGALFLVPGSDGTCRALREQQAMGLPAIVTPRPPLPEIIEEGVSGLIAAETVEGLERALERLVADAPLRGRLQRGARETARRRFDLDTQAAAVTAFYAQVLAAR